MEKRVEQSQRVVRGHLCGMPIFVAGEQAVQPNSGRSQQIEAVQE